MAETFAERMAKVEWPRPCKVPGCGHMNESVGAASAHAKTAHPKPKDSAPPARGTNKKESKPTAVRAASEIAHAGEPTGAASRKPPTAAEWKAKASLFLALLTTWMVLRVISRSDVPDEDHDAWADKLEMGDDEVDAIVDPFVGVIVGPLGSLNKKYGRGAVELLGVLPAVLAMVTWRTRVRDFERHHCPPRQQRRGVRNAPQPGRADGETPAPAVYNGSTAWAQEAAGLVVHPGTA